ncbi:hypothetical protein Pflav_013230 [Phytohabitans flavus]|uniref:Uncharacterized protein n=1 Tax=Phytohabitans flavus TaxID=1076124 RepID=A0A6F8XM80_9ACTN|nr:SDR family NAD(P)-dependent oxidoreductase [Phytohabitans flavus]BCB74913.1 hypothetical protein Pflav_013230 [Phytohabitans flavus]
MRGEGAGALLLKPLSRALADGDHIHAVIRGSAVNHGGKVNTLTTPNPNAQADLLVSAFDEAGVDPATIGYMEMHGTGTALGDPIEVNGLKKAFRELRRRAGQTEVTAPVTLIGSVKSNIGHLEAAAGMAGVFKVILAMRHGRIPGNLHIANVNPHVQLDGTPLRIARTTEAWPRSRHAQTGAELPRRAGVSSFGFGGINAHLLIEEYVPTDRATEPEPAGQVLVLSARTAEQLVERARDLAAFLEPGPDQTGPAAAGVEAELSDAAAELLDVPPADVPTAETLEDLGFGLARLRDLHDWIVERYPAAAGAPLLPTETLAGVAARIAARQPATAAGSLREVTYTLQVGREPMAYRLALVVNSARGAAAALRRYADSGDLPAGGYAGQADPALRGTPADPAADLPELARHWTAGGEVDWPSRHSGDQPRRVSLPTYPFARVRHWITTPTGERTAPPRPAPWTAFDEPTGDLATGLVYRTRLTATDPVVREHRVHGAAVLPGVGHLEIVHAAVAHAVPEATRLTRVVWLRPLAVPNSGLDVLVHLTRTSAGIEYQVRALEGAEPVTYSQGVWDVPAAGAPPLPPQSLARLRDRCPRMLPADELYARFRACGIDYGPFFRGLREIRAGDGEVFATARAATADPARPLHPTLMDAALQAVAALDSSGPAPARLPFALEEMRADGPLGTACHIHVRKRGADGYDVDLLDEDGRVLVALRELSVREAVARETSEPFFYAPYWERQPAPAGAPPAGHGSCLVVHPAGAFGLARDIAAAWPAGQARTLQLDDEVDISALARRLRDVGPVPHVWFLGGLRESATDYGDPAPTLFALVKALAEADLIQGVETLRVLVNGVHDPAGRRTTNPAAGALVGFVKALGKEYPRIAAGCLDIGVPVGAALAEPDRAALVRAVLAEPQGDDEVALVDGHRYVKRLRPVALAAPARPVFRERGTYVIVGGAGGIGQALARHLASTCRARLVLVGRRIADATTAAELAALQRLGGEALYRDADVTDAVRLAGVLAEARERFGRIHGVVHAAMVLRDGILERMDAGAFTAVLAPKARGTEVLGDLLRGDRLDFLLHLSSVQSFTGAAGQANYAAASTAQDAHARRLAGRGAYPVKVVNWGYWGEVGRVASESYRRGITARGFHPIGTAEGMDALERVLACDESQVVAVRAEPEVLAAIGVREPEPVPPRPPVPDVAPLPLTDAGEWERAAGEDFTARVLLRSLRRAGLFPHPGAGHTDPHAELGALPRYRRLVDALAAILVRHGLVAYQDGRYTLLDPARPVPDGAGLRARFPDLAARLELVEACLGRLPEVLRGTVSATEVLFPGGSTELLGRVYRGERLAGYCNHIVAEQVAEAVRQHPAAEVRVLEIGGGTGSTTEVVLDALRATGTRVRYTFTDVSDAFLRQAQRTFANGGPVPVTVRRLDIAQPPAAQGWAAGGYDVVLAGNVMHAVADVGAALAHTRELLAPGGRLVLTEVTQVQAFHTVTFGLLDGWWHYVDEANRLENAPLLDTSMWTRRLEHAGYHAVRAFGTATVPADLSQRVIVAHAPVAPPQPPPAAASTDSEPLERWLRRLISDLTAQTLNMPVAEVTPNKPLSSLGLDSIVGVELINRLNAALDITLKTIVIFDHPTVADLTAFVLGRHGEQVAAHAAAAAPAPPPSPLAPAAPLPTAAAPPAPSRVAAAPALAASAGLRAVRFTRPGSPRDLSIAPIEPAAPDPARSRSRSGRFRSTSRTSCWPMACTRSCRTTRSPRAWRCPAWWAGSAQG